MATKIPWATETWNPINGCTKISEGCRECYAEKLANRLRAMGIKGYELSVNREGKWSGAITHNINLLTKPLDWKNPRIIFVCSMGDIFHEGVATILLTRIFEIIEKCPQHTFLLLTKRPENALSAAQSLRFKDYFDLPNIWMGVTAENQEMASKRIPILLKIPAAKRFVSIEPMLGLINLRNIDAEMAGHKDLYFIDSLTGKHDDMARPCKPVNKLDWVIAGCESGPRRREMDIEWVKYLKDQCVAANVPFFFKQKYIGNKKISMPLLDGKVWDQYPETKTL